MLSFKKHAKNRVENQELVLGGEKMDFIMDAPPMLSGDAVEDIKNLREHIIELQDELEYTFKRRLASDGE